MNKFDYVLFDVDGTLLDTREGIVSAIVYTMKKFSRAIPDHPTLNSLIGPPMQHSLKKLYNLSDAASMEMANAFRDIYKTDDFLFNAIPYEGVYTLLKNLAENKIKIGIATYKRHDYAKRLLYKKNFGQYTDFIYGSDFEGILSKSDIIRKCLINIGCADLNKAVYIGDGDSDGKSSNEVGMNFIAVTYGYGFKAAGDAEKYHPIAVVQDCKMLEAVLLG